MASSWWQSRPVVETESKRWHLIVLGIVLLILLGPLMVPVTTNGQVSNREAAGEGAKFIEVSGVEVHYVQSPPKANCESDSKLVVLIHGFGASTQSWQAVQNDFSPCDEVISYDRPAFGFTERPLSWQGLNPYSNAAQQQMLKAIITVFAKGRDVVLVGHSAGGSIAAQFALDNADLVQKLVLESPAILNGSPAAGLVWLTYLPQLNHLGPLLVSSIASSGMQILYDSYHDRKLLTDKTIDAYRLPLTIENWEFAFWEFTRADKSSNVADQLKDFEMPVLLLTGDDDRIVETELTRKLAKLIPEAQYVEVANVGHLVHEEQPDIFLEVVQSFIAD